MSKLLFFLLTLLSVIGYAQSAKLDSLKLVLKNNKTEENKTSILNLIAAEYKNKAPDSCLTYSKKALANATQFKQTQGIAESYLWMGTACFNLGKTDEAITYLNEAKNNYSELIKSDRNKENVKKLAQTFNTSGNLYSSLGDFVNALSNHKEALKLRKEINDEAGIAASYNNLAVTFSTQGNYNESLKNHFASLKMKEKLGNKEGMAVSLNNIGLIYLDQENYEKALTYLNQSLTHANELQLNHIASTCLVNIGAIYTDKRQFKEAHKSLQKALELAKIENDDEDVSNALGNIGTAYFEEGNIEQALKYEFEALALKEKIGDNLGISAFQSTIAKTYFKKNDINNAILYAEKSLALAKKIGALKYISENSYTLAGCYERKGDFKKAFVMQKEHFNARDSIISISNKQEIFQQELKYTYDKQSIADSLNFVNQKQLIHLENEVKLKAEKKIRIALFIGLALVVVFAIFIFNRFKVTKKQKDVIEQQSQKLEIAHSQLAHKTKEIKDSILYAKEIQNAFLKSPDNSKHWFKDIVLLYKPKDVVSGDFYWYKEKGDVLYVAVGDSTGHGVPGAIISVLAIQFFEKTIELIHDNNKLHILNEYMKNEFNKYNGLNENVNIGLDYSIVCIDKKENKIYISGSGENVIVKTKEKELATHKFENINIGGALPPNYEPLTVIYELADVTSLFLYTDGIIDQKGFATKKKLGTKQLKDLLLELNTNDSNEAKDFLENKINNWIGELDQVDDITLMGIQIES